MTWRLRHLAPLAVLAVAACQHNVSPQGTGPRPSPVTTVDDTEDSTPSSTTAVPTTSQAGSSGSSETASPSQAPAAAEFAAAKAVVRAKGYDVADTVADWHTGWTINALAGVFHDSADGHRQQVFFFADGRYLGTDTSDPSLSLRVTGRQPTTVTVRYGVFGPQDPLCCPGHFASVRYHWDGTRLRPLDPIPPVSQR